MTDGFRRATRLAGFTPYRPRRATTAPRLKIDANEATATADSLKRYVEALDEETLNRYTRPDALEAAIGARFGLSEDRVAVTAGMDDGLMRLCLLALEAGRQAVLTNPTFVMLPRYVALTGGTPVVIDWLDGPVPTDALERAIGPDTGVVFLVTPSSPAGEVANPDCIERLAAACARVGAMLVVDQAYVEFADADLTDVALAQPNTVVGRTFSKAWGLAGLRVGYLLGAPEIIEWVKTVGQPYAVATPSVTVARAMLASGESAMRARVEAVRRERAALFASLAALDARPVVSHGNFVLARLGAHGERFSLALGARGISVRWFDAPSIIAGSVRITCPGDPEAFAALMAALPEALKEARS